MRNRVRCFEIAGEDVYTAQSTSSSHDIVYVQDVLLPQLTGDYALRLLNEVQYLSLYLHILKSHMIRIFEQVLLLFREVDFVESGVIEEKLNVVHQFIKE